MGSLSRFVLACLCLAPSAFSSLPPARSYFEARVDLGEPSVTAIRKHLADVEADLRDHPPAGLNQAQRAARGARLDDLRAYRMRGEFPRNLDFPDRLIPYFIGSRGTACAVGHLMILSGGRDLAEEIARARNHAYLPELKDPRLAEWARANGLTLGECARIQPSYGTYPQDILALSIDSRNRAWVVTGLGGMSENVTYFHLGPDDRWNSPTAAAFHGFTGFCTLGDRPLLRHGDDEGRIRLWLGGGPVSLPALEGMAGGPLAASSGGATFMWGGTQGVRKFTLGENSQLILQSTVRAGIDSFPGDTVTHLAWAGATEWIGTTQGLASRAAARYWHVQSYASLGGSRLGGLKAGSSTNVWAGVLNTRPGEWTGPFTPFSEVGLVRLVYQSKRFHRENSPLPSDTILLAAPGRDQSIWFSIDGKKLFRFTPPDRLETMPFTLPEHVHLMEVDTLDRPYLATFAPSMGSSRATGLYRVEGDRLVGLGYPLGPSVSVRTGGRDADGAGMPRTLADPKLGSSGRDVLGRWADGKWGGIFMPAPPSRRGDAR